MTALLGLVFGGGDSGNGALGRIRFAVVNEDQSVLSDLLRSTFNQSQVSQYLDPVFMERGDALKLVNANKISAVLIIETNFLRNYLTSRQPVSLELIKNPAEAIHPAVLEELLGVVVTALNEVSRNVHSDFPEWQHVFAGQGDYHQVSFLIEQAGDKLRRMQHCLLPPLVSYEKESSAGGATNAVSGSQVEKRADAPKAGDRSGIFAYLLLGLSAMFLLFLGQNAMTDLHRELRKRTFERYQTMHQQLWPFILSKIVFAVVMLLLSSAVMLGGGGLIFQIHWQNASALVALVAGYSGFVAALFAVLVALMPDERRAGVLNNLAAMALGLVGGCAFPPRQLTDFLREHITPQMPSYWFADTARRLQSAAGDVPWGWVVLKLLLCGVALTMVAAWLFRRKFSTGLRA